jgi:hypothetical protein
MKVGDIVYYKKDWKGKRPWYLYSISKGDLCAIVLMRDGKITNGKNGQERLNASIVNLNISEIELYE